MEVSMYPQIGIKRTQVGNKIVDLKVDHKQCWVVANGQQVALYCGQQHEPDKYLSFIVPLPQEIQASIAAEVAKLTGGVGSYNAPPADEHEDA